MNTTDIPSRNMSGTSFDPLTVVRGLLGAILGAVLGYFAFRLLIKQGIYAMVLPGALVGIGCGLAMQREFKPLGVVSAVIALVLGVFLEWQFLPFRADKSLSYFLTHLHQVKPFDLLMIALGTAAAYWFGVGRPGRPG